MIEVRAFNTDDLDAMLIVRRDSIVKVAARDYSPEQIRACADRPTTREAQLKRFLDTTTWVAELDGQLIGYTNLGADGYVDCMYIHSAFQRRGAATALLRELELAARQRRLGHLYSDVSITARPFFESRGFIVKMAQRVTVAGADYNNFRMEKTL